MGISCNPLWKGVSSKICVKGLHANYSEKELALGLHVSLVKGVAACSPLSKVPWKMGCIWEKSIWILLDQSECSKMVYTTHEWSPKYVFFYVWRNNIGDCGESPMIPLLITGLKKKRNKKWRYAYRPIYGDEEILGACCSFQLQIEVNGPYHSEFKCTEIC